MVSCIKCGKELFDESKYCFSCGTKILSHGIHETFDVAGEDLVEKVKAIIHEGNVRRIIIRNQDGKTVFEIPVNVGVIGAVLVPILAAISAIGALAMNYTIVVERK